MKRILALLLVAALCSSARASDGDEFTRSQNYPDPFAGHGPPTGPALVPGEVRLTPAEIDRLILPRAGAVHTFPSIDRFTGNEADPLEFRSVKLFADGARIRVLRDGRESEQLRPERQYYFASNATTGIALAVHPDTGAVSGYVAKGGDRLKIDGDLVSALHFAEIEQSEDMSITCGNDDSDMALGTSGVAVDPGALSISSAESGTVITYQAVVAIETDSEWLDGFGDDTSDAMDWITELFLAMNVFYERDIETRLLIGDVILRTGSDPYSVQDDRSAQLSEFGDHWMDNMQGIDRQFAAMLSGRNISGWAFSGIAWIGAYCDYGHVNGSSIAGSYSFNAIGSSFPAAAAAHFAGHELGHNLGSQHTHCYSPPIDRCASGGTYNGVACNSQTLACPADGTGTVMSYCHNLANCDSATEFHPTVQAKLQDRLADELSSGCIIPYTETNPLPEYQSVPGPGATVQFGDVIVGQTSGPQAIQTQNTGTADLTLSCGLSGSGQSAFSIQSCPSILAPAQSGSVQLTCSPNSAATRTATLTLSTSDPDEGQVQYGLSCTGIEEPVADAIFLAGFEN
jgi:hypothetical protein